MSGRGDSRQRENARTDNRANPERHQRKRAQRSLQALVAYRLREQSFHRFRCEKIHEVSARLTFRQIGTIRM